MTYINEYSQTKFDNYFNSILFNESNIEINLYSSEKFYLFVFNTGTFQDKKIIFNTLPNSQSIRIEYQYQQLPNKIITLKPSDKLIFPDLLPFNPRINNRTKTIKADLEFQFDPPPTPSAIPISVPITQMNLERSHTCNNNNPTDITFSTSLFDCASNPNNAKCGLICNSTGSFLYTFKGVQFSLYGTISPYLGSFNVYINNSLISNVDVSGSRRKEYKVLYTSNKLMYGEHNVKLESSEGLFELYKLVFWPAFNVKRVNITDFEKTNPNNWITESDAIGGFKQYHGNSNTEIAKARIKCTKFWVYGARCEWTGNCTVTFNHI